VSLGLGGRLPGLGLAPFAVDPSTPLHDDRSAAAAPVSLLPYGPLTVAAAVVTVKLVDGQSLDLVEVGCPASRWPPCWPGSTPPSATTPGCCPSWPSGRPSCGTRPSTTG
jgi:hypothetical protein